jgi:flagellar motor switch protein FliN/FliY
MAEQPPPAVPDPSPTPESAAAPAAPAPPPEAVAEAAALLADATKSVGAAVAEPPAEESAEAEGGMVDQGAIDELLKQANFDDPASVVNGAAAAPASDAEPFKLPNFQQVMQDAQVSSIDLLRDVELNVKIELGRSRMLVEDVLKLSEGSVVELDKLAGDPVDVFVNERLVARGEVLVLNDNFCVRVNEIVAGVKEEGL